MFKTKISPWDIICEQREEIDKLKKENANLSVIAKYKLDTDDSELLPCTNAACLACAYAHRYSDGHGGYIWKCTKNVKCSGFTLERNL